MTARALRASIIGSSKVDTSIYMPTWLAHPSGGFVEVCEGELIQHCKHRVASYKAPASVEIRTDLACSATERLLTFKLREPYWADRIRKSELTEARAARRAIHLPGIAGRPSERTASCCQSPNRQGIQDERIGEGSYHTANGYKHGATCRASHINSMQHE